MMVTLVLWIVASLLNALIHLYVTARHVLRLGQLTTVIVASIVVTVCAIVVKIQRHVQVTQTNVRGAVTGYVVVLRPRSHKWGM